MYKALNNISRSSFKKLYVRKECKINLKSKSELVLYSVDTFFFIGKNSLRYLDSLILNPLPVEIGEYHSILSFGTKIKQ